MSNIKQYKYPIVIAIINWVFIIFLTDFQHLERHFGLRYFHQARDWLIKPEPPADIIDIEIDQTTFLEIPVIRQCLQKYRGAIDSRCFSRRLHGDLVRALHQQGAKLIVFNLLFRESRGEDDRYFAEAIRDAGNVLLQDYQEKRFIGSGVEIVDVTPPVSPLAQSTVSAPLTIADGYGPGTPLWLFVNVIQTDSDVARTVSKPVLPVVAAHALLLQDDNIALSGLLKELSPAWASELQDHANDHQSARLHAFIDEISDLMLATPDWYQRIVWHDDWNDLTRQRLRALFDWHQQQQSFFLNPYGPYRTLTTIPYQNVASMLHERPDAFRDKIVIVGPSLEWGRSAKGGVIETAYGAFSSTEFVATMLANLRDGTALKTVTSAQATMMAWLAWALIVLVQLRFSTRKAILLLGGLSLMYVFGMGLSFCFQQRLLPGLAIVLQACTAMVLIALEHYRVQRQKLSDMLQARLPPQVMTLFAGRDFEAMKQGIQVWGVCLAADGQGYTKLGESKGERWLATFMLAYQPIVERCVRAHQGIVKDWAGDGMVALWVENAKPDKVSIIDRLWRRRVVELDDIRSQALDAALMLIDETARFNHDQGVEFPLRIGLSYGPLWLSFSDELKVFGDTLNTASRLETLNKDTQTRILITQHFITTPSRFVTRHLGAFLLRGHRHSIDVHELIGHPGYRSK